MAFTGETYQLVDSVNGDASPAWNKKQLALGSIVGLVLGVGAGIGAGYGIWASDDDSSHKSNKRVSVAFYGEGF